jgi:hypothetical protein
MAAVRCDDLSSLNLVHRDGRIAGGGLDNSLMTTTHSAPMTPHSIDRPYEPTTFVERGVSVPFTTPMLFGARVRQSARLDLELLVPNPSGGRGIYILPWSKVRALCSPTLHDIKLSARIAGLETVTPTSVRRAAKQIAAEGFAGRSAGTAAITALEVEQKSLLTTNFDLLLRLVQQEALPSCLTPSPGIAPSATLEVQAKRAIASIAPRIGQFPAVIAASLEQLAELLEPVGLREQPCGSRIPRGIESIKALRADALCLLPDAGEQETRLLRVFLGVSGVTLAGAERAVLDARAAAAEIAHLLTAWYADPDALRSQLCRAEWLMDGWERIDQVWWSDCDGRDRTEILEEIASLLPALPHEVGDWPGFMLDTEPFLELRRLVRRTMDGRTPLSLQDSIARNEALLAT